MSSITGVAPLTDEVKGAIASKKVRRLVNFGIEDFSYNYRVNIQTLMRKLYLDLKSTGQLVHFCYLLQFGIEIELIKILLTKLKANFLR